MHFAIVDTEELQDAYGSTYTSYNIFSNGTPAGSARYRELYDLYEALKHQVGNTAVPNGFPPKRLFGLSSIELSRRRTQLEKFLQNCGQLPEVLQSDAMQDFLRRIILRSADGMPTHHLQVHLMDGKALNISIDATSNCEQILQSVCATLKLSSQLTCYFSIFLAREEPSAPAAVRLIPLKRLASFEVPFAVLHLSSTSRTSIPCSSSNLTGQVQPPVFRLVLRKSYWDQAHDMEVLDSGERIGTDLLYIEALDAFNRGWLQPTPDQKAQLQQLHRKGSKRDFILYARNVKDYGSIHFGACQVDYPHPGCSTSPYVNGRDLVCPLSGGQEAVFRVTRMRCWRLCLSESREASGNSESSMGQLSLLFEYLLARDKLQWVKISSDDSIWICACLQSMVEEMMRKKRGLKFQQRTQEVSSSVRDHRTYENLSVSVTVNRRGSATNTAFEGIGNDDL